jgi:uncharacterized membrane protein YfcA
LSPAAFLPKFFVLSSVILILSGTAQLFVRPRKAKENAAEKLLNRATLTAVISLVIGVAGLLLGLGVLPMPHFG